MKHFYYVVVKSVSDKHYAYVDKVAENCNIVTRWATSLTTAVHHCETKKKAEELANYWNECYKANGTYMF